MIDQFSGNLPQPQWFWGIVEDIHNDPLESGRVRVRCFGIHSAINTPGSDQGIATDELLWSEVMLPTTSASVSGVGESHGLVQGSQVVGVFKDGRGCQNPLIIGAIAGVPSQPADPNKGFNDPDGEYPRSNRVGEPDLNRLARGNTEDTWHEKEGNKLETNVGPDSWSEPGIEYSATYPHNQVQEWPGGIVEEHDSTLGGVRWSQWHPAGTWEQWDSQGNRHIKVSGDDTLVVEGSGTVYAKGNITIIADEVKWRGLSLAEIESDLIKLGMNADEPIALGASLLDWLANHIHPSSQGPTDTPMIKPRRDLLSNKARVE